MNPGRSTPQLCRARVQVSREQECEREREYEALQRNHRSKFGDDDAAREAAGSAAVLRAKELLKSGSAWRQAAELMPGRDAPRRPFGPGRLERVGRQVGRLGQTESETRKIVRGGRSVRTQSLLPTSHPQNNNI